MLNGITGSVGLAPTLAALEVGSTLALANKESLIVGGELVTRAAKPGQIVPVDSEHSAIAQALRSGDHGEIRRLVLTASGGPFRGRSRDSLAERHPGRGARAPHVGHGARGDHELRDPRQQGPGGDRGAPAVRRALRPHRGHRAPAVDRALDGRVRRRLHDRAGEPARHAAADLARPRLAAPRARTSASRSTGRRRRPGTSSPSTRRRSRRSRSRSASARPAAPTRPCSTRPTSRPSRRSTPGASASSTSSTRSSGSSTPTSGGELTLEGVLAAESWARSAADDTLTHETTRRPRLRDPGSGRASRRGRPRRPAGRGARVGVRVRRPGPAAGSGRHRRQGARHPVVGRIRGAHRAAARHAHRRRGCRPHLPDARRPRR